MKLAIFNGSPRYKKSNSKILIDNFLEGYKKVNPDEVSVSYLAKFLDLEKNSKIFSEADNIIIIFPLYTDCMPAIVKLFLEKIAEQKYENKKVGFIIQSGFAESHHSIFVEKYLKKLMQRLNCEYIGTIIKGAVEGIQIMPPSMTKKLFTNFTNLGEEFAKTFTFSETIKNNLSKPYKLSKNTIFFFRIFNKIGLTNYYWNSNLKKNNAFEKRFDKPYV